MKLVFDTKALSDLEAIYDWISSDSPSIAAEVVERMFSSIERLSLFPQMGRVGAVSGTREWVVPRLPYIVVYEVHDATTNWLSSQCFMARRIASRAPIRPGRDADGPDPTHPVTNSSRRYPCAYNSAVRSP